MKRFALLLIVALAGLTACGTTPTQNQQAGIAVAIDLAVGAAVQQGTSDLNTWKARATTFEAAAKSVKTVTDQGAASLATLAADLQPYIAKLGPADVLAANALVTALTPYLQAQIQANPSAANFKATVDIVAQDVINACMAYTGS